jgi:multiple sugar transport system substrate-binding protein
MMVDGQWQVGPDYITRFRPELNYGVAPLPPPAGYPEQAGITVVQGAVVLIPAGAADKGAAAKLLAWMMSPEIVAEEAYITNGLPTSRRAAQDPRFVQVSHLQVFLDLMAHPNASHAVTTPISLELNEALRRVEGEVLHQGSDPLPLLNEVQAEFAPELEKTLAEHNNF